MQDIVKPVLRPKNFGKVGSGRPRAPATHTTINVEAVGKDDAVKIGSRIADVSAALV